MAHDKKAYALTYDRLAIQEFSRLDTFWQDETRAAIESKLAVAPELYGKPLRQTLKGCWTLRVGDYRIVYRIETKTVKILAIIHRSSNYRDIEKRI